MSRAQGFGLLLCLPHPERHVLVRRKFLLSERQGRVAWKSGLGSELWARVYMEALWGEIGRRAAGIAASDSLRASSWSQRSPAPKERPWLLWAGQLPDLSDRMPCSGGHVPTCWERDKDRVT